tara:strand:- start:656 stop:3451 length:2796 start_codon:yes stop_codon:yes gene_type:complete
MANPRNIASKFTKDEGKQLLESAQKIIDEKVLGPNFKRSDLLKGDKVKKEKVTIDGKNYEAIDGELTATVKTKVKTPFPDEQADKVLFKVKTNKITPKKLDDFNINNMQSKDDIIKFIDEVATAYKPSFNKRKRGVQTNEQTKALATVLQKDQTKLSATLLNLKKGETLNAEYILATRELVEASYAKLDELAAKAVAGSSDDILKYRQHFALTSELTKILKGVQTETARALQQFSIPTRTKKFSNVRLDELNKQELLVELGGEDNIRMMAKMYLKTQDTKSRLQFTEQAGSLNSRLSEAISEVFINAILSNPLTHVRNTAGNWITQGIIQTESKIASAMFGGKGGVAEYEDIARAFGKTMATREMWAQMGGSLKNIDKIQSMISGSKAEVRPGKFTAGNFNLQEGSNFAGFTDIAGRILTLDRIPTKLLTVSDNYFKNKEYRAELYGLAYRDTLNKIREGSLPKENAASYLADLVVNPTKSFVEEARKGTLYSVYQTKMKDQSGAIAFVGGKLQDIKNSRDLGYTNFFMNYYLPFIQTPTNVAKFAVERSPGLNLLLKDYRNQLSSPDKAIRDKAKAKMALGSAFYSLVIGMNYGGYATGTSPELGTKFQAEGSKFAMKKTLGIGSGTINIPYGDTTVRVSVRDTLFDPVALMFKQAADLSAIAQMGFTDHDQWEDHLAMATALMLSFGENLSDSTFMSGVSKAVQDYQTFDQLGLKKGAIRWGQGIGTSFVPSIVKQTGKQFNYLTNDSDQRIAVEFEDYIKKAAGFNNSLNKQYDLLGDKVEGWGAYTFEKKDPIRDQLKLTGVEIRPLRRSKTIQKAGLSATVEYTAEEMSFLQKRKGDYAKQGLAELFETDEYKDAQDNFLKQGYIKKVFSNAGQAANADLFGVGENPYSKSEQVNERFEQKATELFSNKILTLNQGKPVVGDYFEE